MKVEKGSKYYKVWMELVELAMSTTEQTDWMEEAKKRSSVHWMPYDSIGPVENNL